MISETTYGSQTKLIGQSLCVLEHGIGHTYLAFAANKEGKRPKKADIQFLALETPRRTRNSELEHK